MKSFVVKFDRAGLRRLIPEEVVGTEWLRWLMRQAVPARTFAWTLLDEEAEEDRQADLLAERHGEAGRLVLNRALLLSIER